MGSVVIGGFEIDAAKTEEHAQEIEVTQFPVEDGSPITDHARRKPRTLSIDGIVTDTPHGDMRNRRSPDTIPSQDFRAYLEELSKGETLIQVLTEQRLYKSMVLQSWSETVSAETGASMQFRCQFMEVLLVENERTVVRVAIPRAKGKDNLGAKPTEDSTAKPPSEKTSKRVSALTDITNLRAPRNFFGLF